MWCKPRLFPCLFVMKQKSFVATYRVVQPTKGNVIWSLGEKIVNQRRRVALALEVCVFWIKHTMKLAWQLANDKEKLWVQIMRAKYQCGSQLLPKISHKSISTNVWKPLFESGIKWQEIRNGLSGMGIPNFGEISGSLIVIVFKVMFWNLTLSEIEFPPRLCGS